MRYRQVGSAKASQGFTIIRLPQKSLHRWHNFILTLLTGRLNGSFGKMTVLLSVHCKHLIALDPPISILRPQWNWWWACGMRGILTIMILGPQVWPRSPRRKEATRSTSRASRFGTTILLHVTIGPTTVAAGRVSEHSMIPRHAASVQQPRRPPYLLRQLHQLQLQWQRPCLPL